MGNLYFLLTLFSLSLIIVVSGQGCLRVMKRGVSPPSDDPPFGDGNNRPLPADNAVQAIITTYGLYCDCVNITSWETYVQPGGGKHYMARGYDITFQVWRPSPTVQDDGCYSLVGENVFTSFTFSEGGLVQLTPTPPSNSIITAQSGDVVGYYTNSRSGNDEGIQLERDRDYNENIIWFLSVAEGSLTSSGDNACPYPVGTGRYLSSSTGAAPMLNIISTEIPCPPSPLPIPSSTIVQPEQSSTPFLKVSTNRVMPLLSQNSAKEASSMKEQTLLSMMSTLVSSSTGNPDVPSSTGISPTNFESPVNTTHSLLAMLNTETGVPTITDISTVSITTILKSSQQTQPSMLTSSLTSLLVSSSISSLNEAFSTKGSSDSLAAPVHTVKSLVDMSSTTPGVSSINTNLAPATSVSYSVPILPTTAYTFTATLSTDVVLREKSLSTQGSMQSSHSTLFSPSSTPIILGPNERRTNSVIPAVIVIVIVLLAISVVAVITVAVLLRKRVTVKKIQLNNDVRNLSNPNYDSAIDTFRNKGSKTANIITTSAEPTYEDLDNSAFDYSLPLPLEYSCTVQGHPKHKESSFKGDESNHDQLYHEVGPDASSRYATVNSSDLPRIPESVSAGNKRSQESNNVMILYEEPLSSAHKAQESVKHRIVFDTIGKYVPTEEQRQESSGAFNRAISSNMHKDMKFFVEDPMYWSPASTTAELYSQLATKKYRELPRDQIRLDHILGSGQFGDVYKATWNIDQHSLELAVKTLKPGASEENSVKFLQEAAIMGQFNHRNVIKMHGVVTLGEPILICLEILDHGDLREYLLKYNPHGSKYDDFMETELMFLRFAKDIAAGMDYLSKKSFVHRDLAARNILLNKYLTCKVADFGMARDLMDDTYYTSSGGKIPVKWTAPEALLYKKYSTDSDVWSYGMVLFEIWSVGRKPFSTLTNSQTLTLLQKSFCQAPPPGCPRGIYEIMVNCWNPEHHCRPSFSSICQKLNESPEKLLYWSPSDDSLSSQVGVCGAELLEAEKLYPDLQKIYIN